ncbi:MAG: YHS domain-containing protein [Caldilineaceae bacterium]|nr:YHS domain-containing protein [Caldilineaceae bacterium]MCB0183706.1 YHS domain-containing protein [Caldilineaceae bacterium]
MAQFKDPVCGMEVASETAKHTSVYKGQMYYFCVPGCKMAFDKNPEKYLKSDQSQHQRHN